MKETPNDSVKCSNPGHCKNHPILKHISDTTELQGICIDTVRSGDTAINIVQKEVLIKVDAVSNLKRNQDTVSLIEPETYVPVTVHIVRNQPIQQEPMTFDLPINYFLFALATVMTVRYVTTCSASWANLIKDLKHELGKA
jgi:hypothetical protein